MQRDTLGMPSRRNPNVFPMREVVYMRGTRQSNTSQSSQLWSLLEIQAAHAAVADNEPRFGPCYDETVERVRAMTARDSADPMKNLRAEDISPAKLDGRITRKLLYYIGIQSQRAIRPLHMVFAHDVEKRPAVFLMLRLQRACALIVGLSVEQNHFRVTAHLSRHEASFTFVNAAEAARGFAALAQVVQERAGYRKPLLL